mgnify:CR=1 FL=1
MNVFWESNPTNIEYPVFWGNTAITRITQKTLRDPILSVSIVLIGSRMLSNALAVLDTGAKIVNNFVASLIGNKEWGSSSDTSVSYF